MHNRHHLLLSLLPLGSIHLSVYMQHLQGPGTSCPSGSPGADVVTISGYRNSWRPIGKYCR